MRTGGTWMRSVRWSLGAPWSDWQRYWDLDGAGAVDAERQACGWCGSVFAEHRCSAARHRDRVQGKRTERDEG